MYCKNCGKKLPENARFCDRCNMSVRKKNDKAELIEELKEERLARRKAQAVEERLRKIHTKQREKRKKVLVITVVCMIVCILSAITAYMLFMSTSQFGDSDMYNNIENSPKTTLKPSETDKPSINPTENKGGNDVIDNEYTETKIEGISFVYPKGFKKKNSEDEEQLACYEDNEGDAVITVYKEQSQINAKEIMKTYADRMGGTVINSLAGDNWYSITISRDLKTYHRKGIVADSTVIFYEFIYPNATSKEGLYTENIEYMDKHFISE